jgi:hypothetical protein
MVTNETNQNEEARDAGTATLRKGFLRAVAEFRWAGPLAEFQKAQPK